MATNAYYAINVYASMIFGFPGNGAEMLVGIS